jgi:hypothetical protein
VLNRGKHTRAIIEQRRHPHAMLAHAHQFQQDFEEVGFGNNADDLVPAHHR